MEYVDQACRVQVSRVALLESKEGACVINEVHDVTPSKAPSRALGTSVRSISSDRSEHLKLTYVLLSRPKLQHEPIRNQGGGVAPLLTCWQRPVKYHNPNLCGIIVRALVARIRVYDHRGHAGALAPQANGLRAQQREHSKQKCN